MSQSGATVVGSVVAAIVLSLAPVFVWTLVIPKFGDRLWGPSADTAVLELLLLGTAVAVILWVPGAPTVRWAVPNLIDGVLILATSPLLWGVGILVGILSHVVGVGASSGDIDTADRLGPAVVVAIILVGPAEELLFRGIVQPLLVESLGQPIGVAAMGCLFGLYHYPNSAESLGDIDTGAVREMGISGLGGVVLGGLYFLTGNLLVPIVGHSLHDAGLFIYLDREGSESDVAGEKDTDGW